MDDVTESTVANRLVVGTGTLDIARPRTANRGVALQDLFAKTSILYRQSLHRNIPKKHDGVANGQTRRPIQPLGAIRASVFGHGVARASIAQSFIDSTMPTALAGYIARRRDIFSPPSSHPRIRPLFVLRPSSCASLHGRGGG
jgi:hypothetical protein